MLLYANKVETKEKEKLTGIKINYNIYICFTIYFSFQSYSTRDLCTRASTSRDIRGRNDALAGAGMKTEQISRKKAGFMQSRATTIILRKLLLATRNGPNFFAIPRGTGFRNRLNFSSGKYKGTF